MQETQETQVRSLGWEMTTHSINLAWKIPRTEEPDGLELMGSQKVDTTEHSVPLFKF